MILLKRLRINKGLTETELAHLVGAETESIKAIERGDFSSLYRVRLLRLKVALNYKGDPYELLKPNKNPTK